MSRIPSGFEQAQAMPHGADGVAEVLEDIHQRDHIERGRAISWSWTGPSSIGDPEGLAGERDNPGADLQARRVESSPAKHGRRTHREPLPSSRTRAGGGLY